ncbi:hypothetical protein B296_00028385 [Ensete ventricosum]|uniref:Uncharacterized protein n=1 Tax=Ensete ventricosum TaxID=4639 RepID=A0A426ZIJ9_ENSVE|nr:hypothetical protein B296_00028385 [Ensete ventricosum]
MSYPTYCGVQEQPQRHRRLNLHSASPLGLRQSYCPRLYSRHSELCIMKKIPQMHNYARTWTCWRKSTPRHTYRNSHTRRPLQGSTIAKYALGK